MVSVDTDKLFEPLGARAVLLLEEATRGKFKEEKDLTKEDIIEVVVQHIRQNIFTGQTVKDIVAATGYKKDLVKLIAELIESRELDEEEIVEKVKEENIKK